MKKGLLFTTALAALSLGIVACGGNNGGGGSKLPDVHIKNKEALQAEWFVEDEDRAIQIEIEGVVIADAIFDGDLKVTSSNEDVVSVTSSMLGLHAEGKGEATITATYKGKKSDSVKLEVKVHPTMRVVTEIDTAKTDYKMRWYIGEKALYAAGTKGQVDTKSPYYLDPADYEGASELSVKEEAVNGDYKYSITFANGNIIAGKRDSSHTNIGFTTESGYEKLLFKFNENYTFSCKLALNGQETEYWLAGYGGTNEKRLALQTGSGLPDKALARLVEMGDPIPATSVSLDKETLSMKKGASAKLVATLEPSTTTSLAAWESSDESVVKVLDGVVVAYKEGTATITASADGHKAECAVTVSGVIDYGTKEEPLTPEAAHALLADNFADGTQCPFYIFVKGIAHTVENTYQDDQSSKTVTLLKSDGTYVENFFTVYGGKLDEGVTVEVGDEIVARGYAKIYNGVYEIAPGKGLGDQKNTNPLILSSQKGKVDLTGIEIDPKEVTVNINKGAQTAELKAKPLPAGATLGTVTWSISANEKNVTIDQNGKVSVPADVVALNAEPVEFTVTAKHDGVADATAKVIVKNEEVKPTEKVVLTKASITQIDKDGKTTAYATYDGLHDFETYAFTTKDVMPNAYVKQDVIQFKAGSGAITMTKGSFSKVTIKFITTYDWDSQIGVDGDYGDATEMNANRVKTEWQYEDSKGNKFDVYLYTLVVELSAAKEGIKITKHPDKKGAGYCTSIELE